MRSRPNCTELFVKIFRVLHCGKQEKSRRGKIVIGTYGVRRPKKKKKHAITNPIEVESVLSDKLQKKSKKKAE
jgi:ribosomal small subunit protein bTHX